MLLQSGTDRCGALSFSSRLAMSIVDHLLRARTTKWFFLALCLAGSLFITRMSIDYFIEGELHPFVMEKALAAEELFAWALQVHVAAAALSLPACLLLVSRRFVRGFPRAHRWLGRVTGVAVLFALVPSGAYMAFFAKGGVASTLGFLLSGVIVAVAMVRAVERARARDWRAHRRFTLHVLAQLSVAVTSRAMLFASAFADVDADVAYIVALWLPVVGSALVAERIAMIPRVEGGSREARIAPAWLLDPDPVR
jgi:hypothetical protein